MLNVQQQIQEGLLVCPKTKDTLFQNESNLITKQGLQYLIINDTPILIDNEIQHHYLLESGGTMKQEYDNFEKTKGIKAKINKIFNSYGDYASQESYQAFKTAIADKDENALCLSIGGGPRRAHPNLVNLNIGLFPNVDVVADAYALPYKDKCVDSIFCGAVLEHLEFPEKAVQEMFRVLKPGGYVYSDTPFIQAFHGYPNHYQNFTLIGHERLYARNGFKVINSGVCVGPTYVFADITLKFLQLFFKSGLLQKSISKLFLLAIYPFRRKDNKLNSKKEAYILASTTFVLAKK